MIQQLTIKLSIEADLCLASIDTEYGIYLFQSQDATTIASFLGRYIDSKLEILSNDIMGSTNENNELVNRLLADARNMLQGSFDEADYRETLAIVEGAESRGLLGVNKTYDNRRNEIVNIANDILRNRELEETELSTISRQPKALYIYIALVAIGLISA
jgi:hypothetical protein